jgi:hypothetical protein
VAGLKMAFHCISSFEIDMGLLADAAGRSKRISLSLLCHFFGGLDQIYALSERKGCLIARVGIPVETRRGIAAIRLL